MYPILRKLSLKDRILQTKEIPNKGFSTDIAKKVCGKVNERLTEIDKKDKRLEDCIEAKNLFQKKLRNRRDKY